MVLYTAVQLEQKIRALLTLQGLGLQYEQVVQARRNDFPKPRNGNKQYNKKTGKS